MGYDNCGCNNNCCCNYSRNQGGVEWIWIVIAVIVILCLCGDNNFLGFNNSCDCNNCC